MALGAREDPAGRGGFTLIEVMAAVVIVSIVLVSILVIRTRNVQDAVRASRARQAAILAETVLEDALIGLEPDLDDVLPPGFSYSTATRLETVGDDHQMVLVTVEVTYPAADGEQTVLLSSYRDRFAGEEFPEDTGS